MTGPQMLIVAVILMFVIAFAITMIVLNAHAKNMISTNKKLVVNWIDQEMEEKRLYTDSNLTLKTMAKALGLTQKRLFALFKNNEKYSGLGDYLNEKRLLLACRLLRENPNWTIEAVGTEAGFGSRRTFQMEMKRQLGITPLQYRQGSESVISQ